MWWLFGSIFMFFGKNWAINYLNLNPYRIMGKKWVRQHWLITVDASHILGKCINEMKCSSIGYTRLKPTILCITCWSSIYMRPSQYTQVSGVQFWWKVLSQIIIKFFSCNFFPRKKFVMDWEIFFIQFILATSIPTLVVALFCI